MRPRSRHPGMSLVEILIAIALSALLAILAMPKFMIGESAATGNLLGQTEQMMQQVIITLELYENQSGTKLDLSINSLESVMSAYGNYFAHKTVSTSPVRNYFLMADGSRLTAKPLMYAQGYGGDYASSTLTATSWDQAVPGDALNAQRYCGSFPDNQCLYFDYNGKQPPNKIGKDGDIIPLRVDVFTGEVRTLYDWQMNVIATPSPTVCSFVSIYDVKAKAAGASTCP